MTLNTTDAPGGNIEIAPKSKPQGIGLPSASSTPYRILTSVPSHNPSKNLPALVLYPHLAPRFRYKLSVENVMGRCEPLRNRSQTPVAVRADCSFGFRYGLAGSARRRF